MINISMIKSSCFNGCRNYVGNWSHLEAAEKVCSEDFTQPRSGEKRSGAPSSRRSPLPGRLLCKYERYFCNKYQYIFAISLMSLVIELLSPVLQLRTASVPQGSMQGLSLSVWNGLKMQSPQSTHLVFSRLFLLKIIYKTTKIEKKTGAYLLFTL